ncbi:MAG TPA: hypothetical protein VFK43_01090 [Acidimicrobiales bacterium]|nr:hypothetical protein [Acidimicrobiales bacterium]
MVGTPKTAPETGLRRVSWVRIVVDDAGPHCEVLGVGHRLPTARRVSLDTALALAASGVPTVVRSAGAASDQALAAR